MSKPFRASLPSNRDTPGIRNYDQRLRRYFDRFRQNRLCLLGIVLSKTFPPGGTDPIKMLKNDLAYFAPQRWRTVALELLDNIETIGVQPILALGLALHGTHMHRLVTLIRIEEESPALNKENGGHQFTIPL